MPTIHAFVSDMDDTLLNKQHQMTQRTEQTLRRLLARGIKVSLASGRSAASMWPTVQQIETPFPYIAYNGAQIVDPKTRRVLYANEIPLALARQTLQWLEEAGVHAQYYHGDDWFFTRRNELTDEYGRSSGVEGTEAGQLSRHIQADAPKILAILEPEKVPGMIEAGKAIFGDQLIMTCSKPYFIEITSPLATKGNAIRKLAEMIDLRPETTICAGDSLNDLTMLSWSKLPVAVANARDEVKALAWKIAGTSDEDGIAILLDELFREE